MKSFNLWKWYLYRMRHTFLVFIYISLAVLSRSSLCFSALMILYIKSSASLSLSLSHSFSDCSPFVYHTLFTILFHPLSYLFERMANLSHNAWTPSILFSSYHFTYAATSSTTISKLLAIRFLFYFIVLFFCCCFVLLPFHSICNFHSTISIQFHSVWPSAIGCTLLYVHICVKCFMQVKYTNRMPMYIWISSNFNL